MVADRANGEPPRALRVVAVRARARPRRRLLQLPRFDPSKPPRPYVRQQSFMAGERVVHPTFGTGGGRIPGRARRRSRFPSAAVSGQREDRVDPGTARAGAAVPVADRPPDKLLSAAPHARGVVQGMRVRGWERARNTGRLLGPRPGMSSVARLALTRIWRAPSLRAPVDLSRRAPTRPGARRWGRVPCDDPRRATPRLGSGP